MLVRKNRPRKNGRRPGQQVGRAATGHEPAATASADAQRAAFGTLQQHDADQAGSNQQMDDEQNGGHEIEVLEVCGCEWQAGTGYG